MRDIVLTAIIFGLIPGVLTQPYIGILAWSWIGYMNPHRLTWGFAYKMPFAEVIAIATLVSILASRERKRFPITAITVVWLAFIAWMGVTTVFALVSDDAWNGYIRIIKIQLVTFLTIMVMCDRQRVTWLIWVIVGSIGFFSVKGGLFTLMSGGSHRVWGPDGSFIADNNALALATLMTVPLMYYLILVTSRQWIKLALFAAIVLSVFSALGSHSRGAIIAGLALAASFWLKSQKKGITFVLLILLIPVGVSFMPQNWEQRISTLRSSVSVPADQIDQVTGHSNPLAERDRIGWWPGDGSAIGRVNAWNYAINIANARLVGGGIESWSEESFERYAPIPEFIRSSHSIYFGILADHGWIGLALFLIIGFLVWRTTRKILRDCRPHPELNWLSDLVRMIQLSLLAFVTGGAFLGLAYFDLPWHLVSVVVICRVLADEELASLAGKSEASADPPPTHGRSFTVPKPAASGAGQRGQPITNRLLTPPDRPA